MGRPYSNDLRERVAASAVGGRSCRATATLFGVSVASAVKWSQRLRATGSAAARLADRKQPRSLSAERDLVDGAACGQAGPDAEGTGGRTQGARRDDELRLGAADRDGRGRQLRKKRCSPPSRIDPTWRESGCAGGPTSIGLIRPDLYSSTKPGRSSPRFRRCVASVEWLRRGRPIWRGSGAWCREARS